MAIQVLKSLIIKRTPRLAHFLKQGKRTLTSSSMKGLQFRKPSIYQVPNPNVILDDDEGNVDLVALLQEVRDLRAEVKSLSQALKASEVERMYWITMSEKLSQKKNRDINPPLSRKTLQKSN